MELYFHSKLNIGVFLITAIIIAGILIWAKTFVFDAVPERDSQTNEKISKLLVWLVHSYTLLN